MIGRLHTTVTPYPGRDGNIVHYAFKTLAYATINLRHEQASQGHMRS
ncbi:hypothetical protein [Cupriavidus numazuensis]|nr:hypothetical protein [Cupriavidus numazuensis]